MTEQLSPTAPPVANAPGRIQHALAQLAAEETSASASERAAIVRQARDTLGVAFAAIPSPGVQNVLRAVRAERGEAVAWGQGARFSRPAAALVNGTAVQALEFDDIVPQSAAHLSSVMFPVLSACAAEATADDVFAGVAAGLRAARAVGPLLGRRAHARGVQPTHTLGAIAAAIAVARALGMTAAQCSDTLALAVSGLLGTRAQTGTPAKAVQSGIAAAAVVRAVELAQVGTSAGGAVVDAVLSLLGEAGPDSAELDLTEPARPSVKPYPCCGAIHSAVEAVLRIRPQAGPSAVPDRLEIRVPPRVGRAMPFEVPASPDEARWSAPFAVDQAWRHGGLTIASFSAAAVHEYQRHGRPAWLHIVGDESLDPDGEQAVVRAEVDGAVLQAEIAQRQDYPGRPLDDGLVMAKFMGCVTGGLDVAAALALWTSVEEHPLQAFLL